MMGWSHFKKINQCIGRQQIPKADERVSEIG